MPSIERPKEKQLPYSQGVNNVLGLANKLADLYQKPYISSGLILLAAITIVSLQGPEIRKIIAELTARAEIGEI